MGRMEYREDPDVTGEGGTDEGAEGVVGDPAHADPEGEPEHEHGYE
jgi:hypothetical protein